MKNFSLIWSLIIIATFAAAVFVMSDNDRARESLLASPVAVTVPDAPPAGYVKYENKKYGFYYYYSPDSTISEYDEGGGAMTVVQENSEKTHGLQIFIVPYNEEEISKERFLKDVPSGVRQNIEETTIGKLGVPAVTFNSRDQFLGETREVWFIYNGYLFEVTTFKGFDEWLAPIMQTWRFTN